jgi:hypothetical protein
MRWVANLYEVSAAFSGSFQSFHTWQICKWFRKTIVPWQIRMLATQEIGSFLAKAILICCSIPTRIDKKSWARTDDEQGDVRLNHAKLGRRRLAICTASFPAGKPVVKA